MARRKNATLSGAAAMTHPLPLGHTAEVRAQKMRALRAEAGRKAKADLDAARERFVVVPRSSPPRFLRDGTAPQCLIATPYPRPPPHTRQAS